MSNEYNKNYYEEHKEEIKSKSKSVGIRFTIEELELIDERATKVDLKRSEYIKKCVWEKSSQPILKLDFKEWLLCIVLIGLVIATELINTAIEAVVDLACPEVHPLAKTAKDTAAAAVLVFAMTSLICGLFLFVPKLLELL